MNTTTEGKPPSSDLITLALILTAIAFCLVLLLNGCSAAQAARFVNPDSRSLGR